MDREELYGVHEHALFARGVGAWFSVSDLGFLVYSYFMILGFRVWDMGFRF